MTPLTVETVKVQGEILLTFIGVLCMVIFFISNLQFNFFRYHIHNVNGKIKTIQDLTKWQHEKRKLSGRKIQQNTIEIKSKRKLYLTPASSLSEPEN